MSGTAPVGAAGVDPDKPAVVEAARVTTFGELESRSNRLARALLGHGVGPGDRVASALQNGREWFEVGRAAGRVGATVVPVSWRAKRDEVRYLVEDSGAKVLFAEPEGTTELEGLGTAVVVAGTAYEELLAVHDDAPLEPLERPLVGFRYYTSGTSGRPKAVELELPEGREHQALRALTGPPSEAPRRGPDGRRILGRGQTEGLEESDEVHLLVGPAYHTAPGTFANRALAWGQTLVVMRRFEAEQCLRLIEEHGVTWTHMVPINFVRILKLPAEVRRSYDLGSLRRVLHAAAPCPVEVKRAVMELFPPGVVYEYYGATEGLATVCPAEEWEGKPGTVGRAAPGVEVRILDDEGHELGPGQVGNVYVSPMVRFRYAGAPDKSRQAWRGDLFTVGDMGYLDEDGYLFLTDRKIDLIISGGANVYPAEVEAVLYRHPAVHDVAVFGVPDPEWGERVHAVVEAAEAVSEEELLTFCREHLAHYKCPTSWQLVDRLPRDPNGKVRKRLLREEHWAGSGPRI